MIWPMVLTSALQAGSGVTVAPNAQVHRMDDETNGYVEMNEKRQLFIYYDDRPGVAVGSFPGEPGYPLYLELARGIEPGERRRVAKAIAMYERRPDGAFAVHRYLQGAGGAAEPGVDLIGPSDARHRCYSQILGDSQGPGQHYLLLSDWRAICKCQGGPAAD
jgi:hypothetical protein